MLDTKRALVLVGTKKGLFIYTSDAERREWSVTGPHLPGHAIFHAIIDPRSGRLFAAANDNIYGPQVNHTDDLGETWHTSDSEPRYRESDGLTVEQVWHIEPGRASEPGVVYAGVAPAGLFRSDDNGSTWTGIDSLNFHPTREAWVPGLGGLCLHSILHDPERENRMYVAISAAGVFRTDDGGATWEVKTSGVIPEVPDTKYGLGRCPHRIVFDAADSQVMYLHSHSGVYRSIDAGENWIDANSNKQPVFGFVLSSHPFRSGTLYALPLVGAEFRVVKDGKFAVWRTADGGESWEPLTNGLPQENAYLASMREGMSVDSADPLGIYVGTNTGQVFYSRDEGEQWHTLADMLPPVLSVEALVY